MKSFKQFIVESAPIIESMLDFPSSFGELRSNDTPLGLSEEYIFESVVAAKLSPIQARAVYRYTGAASEHDNGFASSKNINYYLRNRGRSGNTTALSVAHHPVSKVHQAVQELSSAFTPETTNKEAITAYSGIPANIGKQLSRGGNGGSHILSGFTSTSINKGVAKKFAINATPNSGTVHMMQLHIEPGAGLPVMDQSHHDTEEEVLLHHGAHITYHGSTEEKPGPTDSFKKLVIHHVRVSPRIKALDSYKPYKEVKETPTETESDYKPDHSTDAANIENIDKATTEKQLRPIISRRDITAHALNHIIKTKQNLPTVARLIAKHPNSSSETAELMLQHPSKTVATAALASPKLNPEVLHNHVMSNIKDVDTHVSALENPKLLSKTAEAIYNNSDRSGIQKAAKVKI